MKNRTDGEITGRLAVTRDGGAVVFGEGGCPLLAISDDRVAEAGAMNGDTVAVARLKRQPVRRAGLPGPAPGPGSGSPAVGIGSIAGSHPAAAPIRRRPLAERLPSGKITRIVERANPTVVGVFQRTGREEFVVPDDQRLPRVAVRRGSLGAMTGEKVVVALATYPRAGNLTASGSVVERLGPAGEPDTETLAIIRRFGVHESFPKPVLAEAETLPTEVGPADLEGRLDLRSETVFTIDDIEARDLDDAVSLTRGGATRRLGVHIADVSHYVKLGSALEREARERGTSVYLVDRVLPMFPPRLSNGIASLHPAADRLTLSVFMDIDDQGRVVAHEIRPSVIRSVARLTYDAVAEYLRPVFCDEPPESADPPEVCMGAADLPGAVRAVLKEMAGLAADLRRRRMVRGSLDFDLPEEKIKLDDSGRPAEIVLRPRNVATQLIEEFMIAANEAVADHLLWSGVPYIARIHEEPFPDDLEALREMLAPLGYRVPVRSPRPADLQAIVEAARGRPEAGDVHSAILRSLPLARYSAVREPHFALASPNYLHFTSPIRRYPDFAVHRQVKAVLAAVAPRDDSWADEAHPDLQAVAIACSHSERQAEKAERASLELKKVELAKGRLGSVEEGVVTDCFRFGCFVKMACGVEGLVPASSPGCGQLRTGRPVRVRIVRADLEKRHVELWLEDDE